MEIIKVVGFSIFSAILIVILKEEKKEFALILSIVAGVLILIFAMEKINPVLNMLYDLVNKSSINSNFLIIILKVTGIAYLVEFGKNICMDAGQSAISTKLELAGKIMVVALSLPVFNCLISLISQLV